MCMQWKFGGVRVSKSARAANGKEELLFYARTFLKLKLCKKINMNIFYLSYRKNKICKFFLKCSKVQNKSYISEKSWHQVNRDPIGRLKLQKLPAGNASCCDPFADIGGRGEAVVHQGAQRKFCAWLLQWKLAYKSISDLDIFSTFQWSLVVFQLYQNKNYKKET